MGLGAAAAVPPAFTSAPQPPSSPLFGVTPSAAPPTFGDASHRHNGGGGGSGGGGSARASGGHADFGLGMPVDHSAKAVGGAGAMAAAVPSPFATAPPAVVLQIYLLGFYKKILLIILIYQSHKLY